MARAGSRSDALTLEAVAALPKARSVCGVAVSARKERVASSQPAVGASVWQASSQVSLIAQPPQTTAPGRPSSRRVARCTDHCGAGMNV